MELTLVLCFNGYKKRVQLYLECRFLKRISLKLSKILFNLVPISNEEYERRFN